MIYQRILKIVNLEHLPEIELLLREYKKMLLETEYFLKIDLNYSQSDKRLLSIELHIDSIGTWNQFVLYEFKKINNWFRFNLLEKGWVQVIQLEKLSN
ncbi:MAG: hypothetical protein IPG12_10815 [Saprospiraceae bacterium]|nr:hypothetical protein [Saprospiraceae bacterium]